MGGKGQRRRQKNFVASHGGDNRLPPPPKPKDVDVIPFKLRRLMELQKQTPPPHPPGGSSNGPEDSRKKRGAADGKAKRNIDSIGASKMNLDGNNHDTKDEVNKKKKRKRKAITDPQIQKLIFGGEHLTKRQRKKEYLDARKKKHKKPKEDGVREFPGRENVKFGEVVDAPPKLSIPKVHAIDDLKRQSLIYQRHTAPDLLLDLQALKMPHNASKERLRLQAVEAYRNRKGWASRRRINLPSTIETPSI